MIMIVIILTATATTTTEKNIINYDNYQMAKIISTHENYLIIPAPLSATDITQCRLMKSPTKPHHLTLRARREIPSRKLKPHEDSTSWRLKHFRSIFINFRRCRASANASALIFILFKNQVKYLSPLSLFSLPSKRWFLSQIRCNNARRNIRFEDQTHHVCKWRN